ncbi:MAG: hypothetical protein WBM24_20315 [Candidatus Sulfotelmatobacter sp.]
MDEHGLPRANIRRRHSEAQCKHNHHALLSKIWVQGREVVHTSGLDERAYDVGIEHGPNFLRVQVKSSSYRRGDGYCCQLLPNHVKKRDYSLDQIDLFAAYVIPVGAWYLIPASLVLGVRRITCVMLSPVGEPTKKKSYCYECYREAWSLLGKTRRGLGKCGE